MSVREQRMKRQRTGQHVTEDKKSKELAVGQDSSLHSSLTPFFYSLSACTHT